MTQSTYAIKWEFIKGEFYMNLTWNAEWRSKELVCAAIDEGRAVQSFVTATAGFHWSKENNEGVNCDVSQNTSHHHFALKYQGMDLDFDLELEDGCTAERRRSSSDIGRK